MSPQNDGSATRSTSSRWPRRDQAFLLASLLGGALMLAVFSLLQKLSLGVPLGRPIGYVVPVGFGGTVGFLLGALWLERERTLRDLRETVAARERARAVLRRFKRASEATGHAVFITAADGTIEYVNPSFERETGYEAADALGRTPRFMYPEDSADQYEAMIDAVHGGERWDATITLQRADGDRYYAQQTAAPIIDDGGSVDGFVAILTDVTDRVEQARQLRHYEQAVESSTNLLVAVDREYGILFANRRYREFHDLDERPTDRTLSGVLDDAAFQAVKPHIDAALDGRVAQFQVERAGPDGERRQFEVRNYPLEDEHGDVNGVVAAMTDVTEKRKQERELETQKQRYESLFSSIRDAIVVADRERRIVDCNPACADLFGYDLDTIEGESTRVLYASESDFEAATAVDDGQVEREFPKIVQFEKRSGGTFPGEENLFYLRDADDEIVGYVGLIRDVSEREDRTQQLQVLDRVLRHNITNAVNVITGYAEMIADVGSEPVPAYARTIQHTGERLGETAAKERRITAVLSRSPEMERVDLLAVVADTVDAVEGDYPDCTITTDFPDTCTATAIESIGMAVEELLVNAVEHHDRDEPEVTVRIDPAGDSVQLIVEDDGPGIPEMERAVLTGDAEIGPLYHGSGLGLWMVKLVVRQSDGALSFSEMQPRGTRVRIALPLE